MNHRKLISNNSLSSKSIKIQDSCLLGPLIPNKIIVQITFLAILKALVLLQTGQNKLILVSYIYKYLYNNLGYKQYKFDDTWHRLDHS